MNHLIVGYGYCGFYLAEKLIQQKQKVWTVSRTLAPDRQVDKVVHIEANVLDDINVSKPIDVIHYMIPPPREGRTDTTLRAYLSGLTFTPKKIVYYGSSGVYGDQEGKLTDEKSFLNLEYDRQYRRLDAEEQLLKYGVQNGLNIAILRIAGIFGPNRIPDKQVLASRKVIKVAEAPWSNSIFVRDLAEIGYLISKKLKKSQTFNVSDGVPNPIGSMHRLLAIVMGTNSVFEVTLSEYIESASPMAKEFATSSKQLSNKKLTGFLGKDWRFTEKLVALKQSLAEMYPQSQTD